MIPNAFNAFNSGVKYLNFGQQLPIRMAHHIFLESKYPENTKNPLCLVFQEETVGFVHDVSELSTGKTVQFYTMMLQSPDKNYRTASYRKVLKDEFAKVAQNKSPVKMTAVKRKPKYFDKTKTDIEVTKIQC